MESMNNPQRRVKSNFFVDDGKIVTGHLNRNGVLVDKRPVQLERVEAYRFHRSGSFHDEVNIIFAVTIPPNELDDKPTPPIIRRYDRFYIEEGVVLEVDGESQGVFVMVGDHRLLFSKESVGKGPWYSSCIVQFPPGRLTVKEEQAIRNQKVQAMRAKEKAVHRLLQEEWPKKWIAYQPRRARKFSSGEPVEIPYPYLTGEQKEVFLGSIGIKESRFEQLLREKLRVLVQANGLAKREARRNKEKENL